MGTGIELSMPPLVKDRVCVILHSLDEGYVPWDFR